MSPQFRQTARRLLALFFALYGAFTLLPGTVYGIYRLQESSVSTQESGAPPSTSPPPTEVPGFLDGHRLASSSPAPEEDIFSLYDTATGDTFQLTAEEFLPAALACEMDLSAPEEALKAQAVALYTFYSYQRAQNTGESADFACDTTNWLVYVPQAAMEERWGEDFPAYYEKLQGIVEAVQGQLLTWEEEPICASFFAISGGSTASALEVWGEDFPYLQTVPSPGDCFVNGYLSTFTSTAEELQTAAQTAWGEEVSFAGPEEEWVSQITVGPSGYVTSVQVGGRLCTGEELREALGLRSACFTLEYANGMFTFTTRGWGHGVGMSQAGAAFLAEQGATYQEILAYYYPGTSLEGTD